MDKKRNKKGPAGFVSLVGAGPGDPGLLTLKGRDCIRKAEVIIYDQLVSPEIRAFFPRGAILVDAGKEGAKHTLEQHEIEAEMVRWAKKGKRVVRLKGGDPFVFGRGGEECQALFKAGVPYEVVPGITSAIGATAYAGIPVTHRDCSDSVAFVTGHRKEGEPLDAISVPDAGTVVFFMGVKNLPAIVARCIQKGRSPATPAALIHRGTTLRQRVVTGTLDTIEAVARDAGIAPPALLVVGDVVQCRDEMRWFRPQPLLGKTVLVTRSRSQASALSDLLKKNGARAVEIPVLRFRDLTRNNRPLASAVARLPEYTRVIFTSANGVDFFFKAIARNRKAQDALRSVPVAVIGPGTGEVLCKRGIKPDLTPAEFVAEGLLKALSDDLKGQRILIPRAAEARDVLENTLRARGAEVTVIPVYKTLPARINPQKVRGADYVTFASSSTVDHFCDQVKLPKTCRVACIGPVTADTARRRGLTIDVMAQNATIPLLVDAIIKDTYDLHH